MAKSKISKSDLDDLKARGYVEGNPSTIPENLSPVIRSQLVEEWAEKQEGEVTTADLPSAVDRGNQLARERAAADEAGKPVAKRQGDAAN